MNRNDRITSHCLTDEKTPCATDIVSCIAVGATKWNGMTAVSTTNPVTADQNMVVSARSVAVIRRVRITPIDQNKAEATRYSPSGWNALAPGRQNHQHAQHPRLERAPAAGIDGLAEQGDGQEGDEDGADEADRRGFGLTDIADPQYEQQRPAHQAQAPCDLQPGRPHPER